LKKFIVEKQVKNYLVAMYLSKILKAVKQLAQDINIIKQDVLYLTLQAGNGGRGLLK
jgi:hypothetical protein